MALMSRKSGRPKRCMLDGRAEAHLVTLSCLKPPEGRTCWLNNLTYRILAFLGVDRGLEGEALNGIEFAHHDDWRVLVPSRRSRPCAVGGEATRERDRAERRSGSSKIHFAVDSSLSLWPIKPFAVQRRAIPYREAVRPT